MQHDDFYRGGGGGIMVMQMILIMMAGQGNNNANLTVSFSEANIISSQH